MSKNSLPRHRSKARPLGLFVIRESDESDRVLFDAMRNQTYIRYRSTIAVEEVRRVGMAPLVQGDSFTIQTTDGAGKAISVEVPVRVMVEGGTRAYFFVWRGFCHLWSMASAAKTGRGSRATNEFTSILMRVVEEQCPTAVLAANFSRLIRSQHQGNYLLTSLVDRVDVVYAGDTQFPLSGPRAVEGHMMFQMFAMVASMERNWIVQRLLTGRIAQWRRGEWTLGGWIVPFGYTYDKKTKTIKPNPDLREAVRAGLIILSSDASPAEMTRQLARVGFKIRKRKKSGDREVVAASESSAPRDYIDSLYSWASVYCHGEFLLRLTNVFPGMTDVAGVPVMRRGGAPAATDTDFAPDLAQAVTSELERTLTEHQLRLPDADADSGELQLLIKVGIPEDGWAEPDILDGFREKATARMHAIHARQQLAPRPLNPEVLAGSANPDLLGRVSSLHVMRRDPSYRSRLVGAQNAQQVPPHAGRGWVTGNWWYQLHATGRHYYSLMRFPLATRGTGSALVEELVREQALLDWPSDPDGDSQVDPIDLEEIL